MLGILLLTLFVVDAPPVFILELVFGGGILLVGLFCAEVLILEAGFVFVGVEDGFYLLIVVGLF